MKLEEYKKSFAEAEEKYHEIMKGENEAAVLLKWMIENDINPYSVFHETSYASYMETLEGLATLYHLLCHSLYDDGDITFVKNNYYPVILFAYKNESYFQTHYDKFVQSNCEKQMTITGYCDNVHEYITEYESCDKMWKERVANLQKRMAKLRLNSVY